MLINIENAPENLSKEEIAKKLGLDENQISCEGKDFAAVHLMFKPELDFDPFFDAEEYETKEQTEIYHKALQLPKERKLEVLQSYCEGVEAELYDYLDEKYRYAIRDSACDVITEEEQEQQEKIGLHR